MRRNFFFSALALLALVFVFDSCSAFEPDTGGGTINLSFDTASLFGSRNISLSSGGSENSCYIVVAIRGDYNAVQSDLIYVDFDNPPTSHSMSFYSLPVGKKVYIEANVYAPYDSYDSDYLHLHTGKSDTILVVNGENSVKIKMTNLTKEDSAVTSIVAETAVAYINGNGYPEYAQLSGEMFFYANGKYQLKGSDGVYSEGIWRYSKSSDLSSFEWNNDYTYTLYLTECIYSNVKVDDMNPVIANFVIVEFPEEKSYYLEYDEETASPRSTTFTSLNGLVYRLGSY